MQQSYIIEIGEQSAGLIVREPGERAYTFFASHSPFWTLEGRTFSNASEAERAVRALVTRHAA